MEQNEMDSALTNLSWPKRFASLPLTRGHCLDCDYTYIGPEVRFKMEEHQKETSHTVVMTNGGTSE